MKLDSPIRCVGSKVRKWEKHHTPQALARQGRPSKLSTKTRWRLARDATVRPSHSEYSGVQRGVKVHQTTVSRALHNCMGLYGRVARKKPLLKKSHMYA